MMLLIASGTEENLALAKKAFNENRGHYNRSVLDTATLDFGTMSHVQHEMLWALEATLEQQAADKFHARRDLKIVFRGHRHGQQAKDEFVEVLTKQLTPCLVPSPECMGSPSAHAAAGGLDVVIERGEWQQWLEQKGGYNVAALYPNAAEIENASRLSRDDYNYPPQQQQQLEQRSQSGKQGRRSMRPMPQYRRDGDLTVQVDEAKIAAMLAERQQARWAKDYMVGDRIFNDLQAMNIFVNDKDMVWCSGQGRNLPAAAAAGGGMSWRGSGYKRTASNRNGSVQVDEQFVEAKLVERNEARSKRKFDRADQIKDELYGIGIFIDDKGKSWSAVGGRGSRGGGGGAAAFDGRRQPDFARRAAGAPPPPFTTRQPPVRFRSIPRTPT